MNISIFFMSLSYTLHQQQKAAPRMPSRSKMAVLNLCNQKVNDLKELSHVDAAGAPTTGEWLAIIKFIQRNF
tara:strand:- start:398 stop:613 length:216 start_codon:yes stop_codon:yes gene_type:complete